MSTTHTTVPCLYLSWSTHKALPYTHTVIRGISHVRLTDAN